jgi:cell division protein ZapA
MAGRTVALRVGGQTYRVVSSASEDELTRLAGIVDDKLSHVMPSGRQPTPQAMLLAAIALAHEAEAQRDRADRIAAKAKRAFGTIVERIDDVLHDATRRGPESTDGDGSPPSGSS